MAINPLSDTRLSLPWADPLEYELLKQRILNGANIREQYKYLDRYEGSRTVMITLRMLPETRQHIITLAAKQDLSVNEYVKRKLEIFSVNTRNNRYIELV